MNYWAEIRSDFFEQKQDLHIKDNTKAHITIDGWKTDDDNESGKVVARVILTDHGDIVVDYHDNLALWDELAQEHIAKAKEELELYYKTTTPTSVADSCGMN